MKQTRPIHFCLALLLWAGFAAPASAKDDEDDEDFCEHPWKSCAIERYEKYDQAKANLCGADQKVCRVPWRAPDPVFVECWPAGPDSYWCEAWPIGDELVYTWATSGSVSTTMPPGSNASSQQVMCTTPGSQGGTVIVHVANPAGVSDWGSVHVTCSGQIPR